MPQDTPAATRGLKPGALQRRGNARSVARLAAVQALYQWEMSGGSLERLLKEFHDHRLGEEIDGERFRNADVEFFNDLVKGATSRGSELDQAISGNLAKGWTLDRLDRPMRQILRLGAYELVARPDVPKPTVISEYVDVAHAFYERTVAGFVNGLLDAVGRQVRG
jgi:N utilization substance protein B